jgi:O-succinylbenzoic acid--CoA ligase
MMPKPFSASFPRVVGVRSDEPVLDRLLPAISGALTGGPAVLPITMPVQGNPPALHESVVSALRPDLPVNDQIAMVVPTSGSTGAAKGVELSRSALVASAEATHRRLGGNGTWMLALPVSHIAGLMVLVRSAVAGTSPTAIDLSGGFRPDSFLAASQALFATRPGRAYTALVPRQLSRIIQAGGPAVAALAQFDAVLLGGSALHPDLAAKASAAGVNIVATYGMTETSGGCVYNGQPLENVQVDTVDDGVLRISGPMLAAGYRLRPDLTEAAFSDGWFRTADLGVVAPDGAVTISGRSDDVAISGGVNVSLAAVDVAIESHPGVREAAAVAVPDASWGERIVAVVVATDPRHPPSRQSIRAHVKSRAPAAYAPQEVVVTDSIPTTPSGKVDRRAVAKLI